MYPWLLQYHTTHLEQGTPNLTLPNTAEAWNSTVVGQSSTGAAAARDVWGRYRLGTKVRANGKTSEDRLLLKGGVRGWVWGIYGLGFKEKAEQGWTPITHKASNVQRPSNRTAMPKPAVSARTEHKTWRQADVLVLHGQPGHIFLERNFIIDSCLMIMGAKKLDQRSLTCVAMPTWEVILMMMLWMPWYVSREEDAKEPRCSWSISPLALQLLTMGRGYAI